MLLRASGQREALSPNLASVTSDAADPGVPHGLHLRTLTEATIRGDWLRLPGAMAAARKQLTHQQVIDTLIVAAAFNGITRVADATGIPLDKHTAATTAELRNSTGIQQFEYGAKSTRYPVTPN